MGQYSKTVIAPIVAVICLVVAGVSGVEVGDDVKSQIVDFVGYGVGLAITLYGIFKNHK